MPARSSRQSTSRAAAQSEAEEGSYNIANLNFTEPLSWRAGKAIPVADLFTRLQRLSGELKNVEQGSIQVNDIAKLAQDLVNANLLGHKDKGIRAWTVTCIVDILNICAPNAPYRESQLKDIFTVIIGTILPALADPSNVYNAQHQYILDQLVDTQSIVLITDIPEPDQLLNQLFAVCFDVVSGSAKNASGLELAQSVVFQIGVLLNTVVEEANLPPDVVDIIISQFLRVDPRSARQPPSKKKSAEAKDKSQSTLPWKDYPPAYNTAKGICTTCSDKMSAAISQYFSSIITTASAALADDEEKTKSFKRIGSPDGESDIDDHESLNDLKKAHRLVKELWRACPDVLSNVIPQLEVELAADSISLRQLAVETIGDLVAGIGLAGLPDLPVLDPAAFPLPTIADSELPSFSENPLLQPSSPKPFTHVHSATYQAFLGRRIDKAMSVRKAWVTAASRILLTNAGGIGLNKDEQSMLLSSYARLLKDVDEKVRFTALEVLAVFPYLYVIDVLGSDGGLSEQASLLSTVAERITDRKTQVREKAMLLLGSMWGVASRDIANNNEQVVAVLGQAPTRLLTAMYVRDPHISITMPKVLYECLLPLHWPPSKIKSNPDTQKDDDLSADPDSLRARRLLTLVRDLDEKAKPVFFGMQKRQAEISKAINAFLKACEDYNGGVMDDSAEETRLEEQLKRFIDSLSKQFPEPSKASGDLWKFAKTHDRRNYQLIRFATGAEHEYKTMTKALKELSKRLHEGGAGMSSILDTLTPILYQCALASYNRSHIPSIMEYARSTDAQFAEAAKEILREISDKVPEVMKTHIQVLCQELQNVAPSETESESLTAADALKACSTFAKSFPDEVPKDKKFLSAMQHFALYSSSAKAAKHAVNIILMTSDKKELRAKEILSKAIKRYHSNAENKLAQLAAIAQVCLHSAPAAAAEQEQIFAIATSDILKQNRYPQSAEYDERAWTEDVDEEITAKLLALKILVNRCRAGDDDEDALRILVKSVLDILMTIIKEKGEYSAARDTPSALRNYLRLGAARSVLKLCRYTRATEELVKPDMLQEIAWMLIHRPHGVRKGLCLTLRKYLSTNKLNVRWITPLFLLAFEPDHDLRNSTISFLKSRTAVYARQQQQAKASGDKNIKMHNVMETTFARLLSLLAHHPDYPNENDPMYHGDLLDFAKNIVFYLQSCSTEDNLSLIFHIAQRTKQAADAVVGSDEINDRLYVLSDLAQATIRNYADQLPASAKGVNLLQTWPGKAQLPSSLFKPINGHEKARQIAAKNYLPEEVAVELEDLVKIMLRQSKQGAAGKAKTATAEKKRKSSISIDADNENAEGTPKSVKKSRKSKSSVLPIRKTPNPKKRKGEAVLSAEQPSRKSARTSAATKVNYEESDVDEDEADDTENIVSYKPAPMENYKHKPNTAKTAVSVAAAEKLDDAAEKPEEEERGPRSPQNDDIDEEAEVEAEGEDGADIDRVISDAETLNGHDDQANGIEDEDEEMADEDDVAEAEATPSKKRASRRKSTPASNAKAKAKSKSKSKSTPKTPVKTANKGVAQDSSAKPKLSGAKKVSEAVSSPPTAEPERRRSKRTRA